MFRGLGLKGFGLECFVGLGVDCLELRIKWFRIWD